MRVIGGIYRHRELAWPKTSATRPTKDMVREAIFSALSNKVDKSIVLDLFAGSGAFAIEAISRGADFAYLVDNDVEANKTINQNITNLKINNAKVYSSDYHLAINDLVMHQVKIDMLFLDPPYQMNDYQKLIYEVNPLLKEDAVIIIESDASINVTNKYRKVKEYKYGKTLVTILWK